MGCTRNDRESAVGGKVSELELRLSLQPTRPATGLGVGLEVDQFFCGRHSVADFTAALAIDPGCSDGTSFYLLFAGLLSWKPVVAVQNLVPAPEQP